MEKDGREYEKVMGNVDGDQIIKEIDFIHFCENTARLFF